MGTVGLAAQAIGARDRAEVAALLTRVLMIGTGAGVALILLQVPILAAALWLSPASAEVEALVRSYLTIRILLGAGGHRALRDHRLADRAGADGCGAGAASGPERAEHSRFRRFWCWASDFGRFPGVAWATFRGRNGRGWPLGLWLCRAAFGVPDWRDWARVFDGAKLWRMAAVNADILIRSLLLDGGLRARFLFFAADFGDVTLAANQVLIQFRLHHRPCDGRFRLRGRGAGGPGHGRARGAEAQARGAADQHLGADRRRRHVRSVPRGGGAHHRPDDHLGGGARRGRACSCPGSSTRPVVACASWMLRRDLHRRHGAPETMRNMMAISFRRLCPDRLSPARAGLGQSRALGRARGGLFSRCAGSRSGCGILRSRGRRGDCRLFVRIIAGCEFSYENSIRIRSRIASGGRPITARVPSSRMGRSNQDRMRPPPAMAADKGLVVRNRQGRARKRRVPSCAPARSRERGGAATAPRSRPQIGGDLR